ncbi:hypothetical protein WICPIJ_003753 [Wickerhamomyces pijperi]|uniref:Uncharacterized protein n=1 Tax=Wickerhamomyces pijperi TaxID=599730 RepID=A0A9P8TNK4_WICPI|nr:hypothetical protein WICPIJ_003753 [Wickerhamomyces pijperi]
MILQIVLVLIDAVSSFFLSSRKISLIASIILICVRIGLMSVRANQLFKHNKQTFYVRIGIRLRQRQRWYFLVVEITIFVVTTTIETLGSLLPYNFKEDLTKGKITQQQYEIKSITLCKFIIVIEIICLIVVLLYSLVVRFYPRTQAEEDILPEEFNSITFKSCFSILWGSVTYLCYGIITMNAVKEPKKHSLMNSGIAFGWVFLSAAFGYVFHCIL